METMGPKAYEAARAATAKALTSSHIQQLDELHWCCYVDGSGGGELDLLYDLTMHR